MTKQKVKKGLHKLKIFVAGGVQVFFVASNVYMLAHLHYLGALFTSFCLSGVWAYNVKKVAIGDAYDGLTYAAGAACGTMLGMWLTQLIYS